MAVGVADGGMGVAVSEGVGVVDGVLVGNIVAVDEAVGVGVAAALMAVAAAGMGVGGVELLLVQADKKQALKNRTNDNTVGQLR